MIHGWDRSKMMIRKMKWNVADVDKRKPIRFVFFFSIFFLSFGPESCECFCAYVPDEKFNGIMQYSQHGRLRRTNNDNDKWVYVLCMLTYFVFFLSFFFIGENLMGTKLEFGSLRKWRVLLTWPWQWRRILFVNCNDSRTWRKEKSSFNSFTTQLQIKKNIFYCFIHWSSLAELQLLTFDIIQIVSLVFMILFCHFVQNFFFFFMIFFNFN